eukprot:CAMPEP_0197542884 /NCGR_PEP_ID=MMETSP1318-20131121/67941_1 /TAXON_ID=552666 /ORGANISM="Partenskyella glossopodia, Strain RCC365" /LENGTH=514 /DNA_ID=CAMNT_0043102177 /DNA_START=809 /DNA_END=2349 /DNA_ORIENTATION=+
MGYRSGWGHKDKNQERILAIDISRQGFEWILSQSGPKGCGAVIQWDPEREVSGLNSAGSESEKFRTYTKKLTNVRSIQIGLRSEASQRFNEEFITRITDVTETANKIYALLVSSCSSDGTNNKDNKDNRDNKDNKDDEAKHALEAAKAMLPRETVYDGLSEGTGRHIGLSIYSDQQHQQQHQRQHQRQRQRQRQHSKKDDEQNNNNKNKGNHNNKNKGNHKNKAFNSSCVLLKGGAPSYIEPALDWKAIHDIKKEGASNFYLGLDPDKKVSDMMCGILGGLYHCGVPARYAGKQGYPCGEILAILHFSSSTFGAKIPPHIKTQISKTCFDPQTTNFSFEFVWYASMVQDVISPKKGHGGQASLNMVHHAWVHKNIQPGERRFASAGVGVFNLDDDKWTGRLQKPKGGKQSKGDRDCVIGSISGSRVSVHSDKRNKWIMCCSPNNGKIYFDYARQDAVVFWSVCVVDGEGGGGGAGGGAGGGGGGGPVEKAAVDAGVDAGVDAAVGGGGDGGGDG